MFSKRIGIALFLWGLLIFPLSASMVCFLVIEAGIPASANAGEYAYHWEGGLMGAFFDAGHIVSNSPVMRLENLPLAELERGELPREILADYNDALEGGAEFFILAILEFNSDGGQIRPGEISIRVFNTGTRALIYEEKIPVRDTNNPRDELMNAQDAGRVIAAQIW